MGITNVPQPVFTSQGLVIPQTSAVLAGVQADYNAAFGGGVNPSLATPQGQLATSQTAILDNSNALLLQLFNNVDPAYATGRMQDAIGRIYFITRNPATATTVTCTCVGAISTIIPAGALATDGINFWQCVSGGTIPDSGTINLTFACQTLGPVPCPINSVNQIFTAIPGWNTVNNPGAGVIGSNVESRADFENRRELTVAANSLASVQSIVGSVLTVPGVTDAFGVSNDSNSPATIGGVSIGANQVYVAVAGSATDAAVAQALWQKKIPGTPWYSGNKSVTVYDTSNGYVAPLPSYTVTWQNPTAVPILFAVTITNSTGVPANALSLVQTAISNAFTGSDGGTRARIGSTIYASRYYAGIASLGPWANIVQIQVGTSVANLNDLTLNINQVPTYVTTNVTLNLV